MFSFLLEICLEVELMDHTVTIGASQVVLEVKNLPASAGEVRDMGSIPGFRRAPGREHGSPLHLPEESQGQKSWAGYSPWDCRESDMTKAT